MEKQQEFASATDVGTNVEAVEGIQKKFREFCDGLQAAESQMIDAISDKVSSSIISMNGWGKIFVQAVALLAGGHPSVDDIKAKQNVCRLSC